MRNRGRTGRDITDRWPEEEEVSSGFMDRLLIRYCISGYSSGRNGISSAESCRGSLLTAVYTVVKKDFCIVSVHPGLHKGALMTPMCKSLLDSRFSDKRGLSATA